MNMRFVFAVIIPITILVSLTAVFGRQHDESDQTEELDQELDLELSRVRTEYSRSPTFPSKFEVGYETARTETETETEIVRTTIETKNEIIPETVLEYAASYGTIMVVDLTKQHVYCCVDGEVIADADCVSGNSLSSPTPTGFYNVWRKRNDFFMLDEYYTLYATFFNNGIAIHDADTWRSEYGGTIYQGSGSHGCINTPRWFAEIVYNNSTIGTPVYVF